MEQINFISKIKINNDGTAIINFKKSSDLDTREIVFSGKEKVTDDFKTKFQEAVSTFVEIVPALKKEISNITMNSISLNYGNDEKIDKVSYAVKYKPQNSVLANIPVNNVPIYKDSFGDETFAVSGKDESLLYEILELAQAYINGDTATKQIKLEIVEG